MKKKKEKNADEIAVAKEDIESELEQPIWSVVTFEKRAAKNLTYMAAAEKLEKLKSEKVAGLCIITDEAAGRLTAAKKKK